MPVIAIIIFLAVFGGMGFAMYKVMKKTDPKKADTSTLNNVSTAQDFLPFEEIKDDMICLGVYKYRAIIECSSINYYLKTDKEKEIIEASFQRFLNSLNFPITFFVQTKIMDNSQMLASLREELLSTLETYPQLEGYAEDYFSNMNDLNSQIGNSVQKKKYIIVPYEEAVTLENLSHEEKYSYSEKELYTRAAILAEGLGTIGIKAHILNTAELLELVYSMYHKDDYSQVDGLIDKDFLTLVTESKTSKADALSNDAKADWILYEAQMRMNNELLGENIPDEFRENCEKCIDELNNLRDMMGSYFKEKPVKIEDTAEYAPMDADLFNKVFGESGKPNKEGASK